MQRESIWKVARALRGKSLHFLETLAAQDARMVQYDPKQFALVIERLDKLLAKDVENQGGNAAVVQKLEELPRGSENLADHQPQSPGLRIHLHARLEQVDHSPGVDRVPSGSWYNRGHYRQQIQIDFIRGCGILPQQHCRESLPP